MLLEVPFESDASAGGSANPSEAPDAFQGHAASRSNHV